MCKRWLTINKQTRKPIAVSFKLDTELGNSHSVFTERYNIVTRSTLTKWKVNT